MADKQEEIIIIEEYDANGIIVPNKEIKNTPKSSFFSSTKNKTLTTSILTFLLLGGTLSYFFLKKNDANEALNQKLSLQASKKPKLTINPSELEGMISRANYMYANGNQAEALKLFEKIALQSESISQYNLGTVRLKEKEYAAALENFKYSINIGENRCMSAINAAVCCLHLNEKENFNYYIDLAQAYLSTEANSPSYSYYYALINYYKGNYIEALSALNHPTTNEYSTVQNSIKASIDALYNNYTDAINALESSKEEANSFAIAQLYANQGDLHRARQYLEHAIVQNSKPIQETLSLVLVNLKLGDHKKASEDLKTITQQYPQEIYTPYPLTVYLKPIFSPELVQKAYRSVNQRSQQYAELFAFAPYKIFNAHQTLTTIRQGSANIYLDDPVAAKEYLEKSTNTSNLNYQMAFAIQKALLFRLKEANIKLQKIASSYPQDSILHYNLALTYAQLNNYTKANEHFTRSYYLDANNYLSGIFAIITSEMIAKNSDKLTSVIRENLSEEARDEEHTLYRTLFNIHNNNYTVSEKWLDNHYKERPFYLIINIMLANKLNRVESAQKASQKLVSSLPHDLLAHLIYIDTHFRNEAPKAFARLSLNYLKKQKLHYNDLYYGPKITQERGIMMAASTGMLVPMINRLEEKLQTTTENRANLTAGLALASFYNQDFEKAYTLYNQAIDIYDTKDERTLFAAASASIGAQHYQNAIALLELSKMTNPNFLENRYALGLLYMQTQNNPAAIIQFSKMQNTGFKSNIFDFKINTEKLQEEPSLYHSL